MYPFEKYLIAQDAFYFLIFWPSIVITLCSLCMNRRRNDPARRALTFLKAAFGLFTLYLFLSFCSDSLEIAGIRLENDRGLAGYYSNPYSLIRNIQYASAQTYAVARLVECITDLFVFIMFVHLGIGILIALSGKPDGSAKALKLASFGIAAVLTIIAIARFGLITNYFSIIYKTTFTGLVPGTNTAKIFMNARRLDFSFYVLIFILSLAIVGQSVMVKMQTRSEQRVSVASNTFIACAVLWLLRSVYNMASMAAMVNFSNFLKDKDYENYYYILDIVFGVIPLLVLLGLVFGLGQKKLNGLWSTEQTFMVNQGDGVTPWGFSYDPNQVHGAAPAVAHNQQPPPPQQQQQQPQMQQDWSQYQQQQYHQQQFQQQQQQFQQQVQPQQYQQPQYQAYNPHLQRQATQPHQYTPVSPLSSEASHGASPPPHEVAMGLNHQANGSPPQPPQPYYEKS